MKLLLFRFIDEEEFRKKINSIFKFAKVKKIDLIVFPENVPWMLDNELYKRLKDLVRSSKVSVLVTKRTKRFSSLLILPNKEVSFDKITHYGLDKKKFIAGKFIKIIKWKRFKFSVLICYDSFFQNMQVC